jgi:glycosyltransferase involved in cell wall biosynthesis
MQKLSIIIPAYNEEYRIKNTLQSYSAFFDEIKKNNLLDYEILVVLNGCKDNTVGVVQEFQKNVAACRCINLAEAGKGIAIKTGFIDALQRNNDYIGFVDADMATSPESFYALMSHVEYVDGVIASRYRPDSVIYPPRPWIKRWGSKLFYESLITLLFGMRFADYQCGAKIFKRHVIARVAPLLTVKQWAFDVELLYLSKKFGFSVLEVATEWHDRAGSKLRISSGFKMLAELIRIRWHHRQ